MGIDAYAEQYGGAELLGDRETRIVLKTKPLMPEVLPSTLEPMVPPLEPAATASSDDEAMESKASSTSSSTDDDTSSSSSEAEEADCLAVEPVLECACSADLPHRQSEYKGWKHPTVSKPPTKSTPRSYSKIDYTAKGIHAVAYPASIQRACSTAQAGPHR